MLPAREIYKQVRVYPDTKETMSLLQLSGLDLDHAYRNPGQWIEFAISVSNLHKLDATNIQYEITHEDLELFYASRLDNEYESRDFDLGSMGGYYTLKYQQMLIASPSKIKLSLTQIYFLNKSLNKQ